MSKKKSVSNSTLMKLWRLCVLKRWGYRDPISGAYDPTGESLQCHHIIKRRHWLTRYDPRNGIPLTTDSHRYAHTAAGAASVWNLVDSDYLAERERWLKPDWLRHVGLSENEWLLQIRDEMKEYLDA